MKRYLPLAVLLVLQLAFLGYTVVQEEVKLAGSLIIQVPAAPVDPQDPFRGRYVQVNLSFPQAKGLKKGGVFASITAEAPDKWNFSLFSPEAPVQGDHYLELQAASPRRGTNVLTLGDTPLRVYLTEELAPEVEALLAKIKAPGDLVLEGAVYRGAFRPQRFLFFGKEVQVESRNPGQE